MAERTYYMYFNKKYVWSLGDRKVMMKFVLGPQRPIKAHECVQVMNLMCTLLAQPVDIAG